MYSPGRGSWVGDEKGLEEAASVYSPGRSRPGFRCVVAAARLVEALLCNAEMHGSTSSRRESGLGFPPHARAHGAVYGGGLFEAFSRQKGTMQIGLGKGLVSEIDHGVVRDVRPGLRVAEWRPQPGFLVQFPSKNRLCRSRTKPAGGVRLRWSRNCVGGHMANPGCGRRSASLNPGLTSCTTPWCVSRMRFFDEKFCN